jgi:polar amino acid transport system permease protein
MSSITTTETVSKPEHLLGLPRKRRFELVRWVVLIVVAYVAVVGAHFLIFNPAWNWSLVGSYLFSQRIVLAVGNTMWLTVLALACGLSLGLVACAARLSRYAVLRTAAMVYVWVVRATPPLVILLIIYFLGALQPTFGVGVPFGPSLVEWSSNDLISQFSAAIACLSIYLGGKSAEIFRAGFMAVGAGQREAVKALGLGPWTSLTRVLGPQAVRVLTPSLANEVVTMFKNTSIVSLVGYAELLTTVQRIYAVNFETIPMLTVACVWYLALTSVLMVGQMKLEQKFGRGFVRRAYVGTDEAEKTRELGPDIPVANSIPLSETVGKKGDLQ